MITQSERGRRGEDLLGGGGLTVAHNSMYMSFMWFVSQLL